MLYFLFQNCLKSPIYWIRLKTGSRSGLSNNCASNNLESYWRFHYGMKFA